MKRKSQKSKTAPLKVLSYMSTLRGRVEPVPFTATDAKNGLAQVIDTVAEKGAVVITRHTSARAVVLPPEEYNALVRSSQQSLASLTAEFDEMFERMQQPEHRGTMDRLFAATPAELGRAAVAQARKARAKAKRGG